MTYRTVARCCQEIKSKTYKIGSFFFLDAVCRQYVRYSETEKDSKEFESEKTWIWERKNQAPTKSEKMQRLDVFIQNVYRISNEIF